MASSLRRTLGCLTKDSLLRLFKAANLENLIRSLFFQRDIINLLLCFTRILLLYNPSFPLVSGVLPNFRLGKTKDGSLRGPGPKKTIDFNFLLLLLGQQSNCSKTLEHGQKATADLQSQKIKAHLSF